MAILVEDGTGEVAGANSYASVAEFQAYWTNGDFDWSVYGAGQQERALILATRYIELIYGHRFKGHRLVTDPMQPLSFPRSCFYLYGYLVEGVPAKLKEATHEYARRALASPGGLAPDPGGYDATGQLVRTTEVKVGPITEKSEYEAGSGAILRSFPTADRLLRDFVWFPGGVIRN